MQAVLHRMAGTAGPQVVFLHGFGADRLSWLAVAPPLGDVAEVFAVDLPGHGDAPVPDGAFSAEAMAEAVRVAVAGLAGPVWLVGHSLGGLLAHLLHHAEPARCPLLALIAPAGFGQRADPGFLTGFPALRDPEEARALMERMVVKPRHIAPAMVAHVLGGLDAVPGRRAWLAAMAERLNGLPPLPVGDLPGDALVIWGAEDRIAAPPPGLSGLLLPGVGHVPQVEAALPVQRALREALARVTAGPA